MCSVPFWLPRGSVSIEKTQRTVGGPYPSWSPASSPLRPVASIMRSFNSLRPRRIRSVGLHGESLQGQLLRIALSPQRPAGLLRTGRLKLTSAFPFITFPTNRAHGVGGITLWGSDWIASVTTAMPLLFVLALWGTITTVRPRGGTSSARIRIVLATAAAAGVTVMVYGWVANRFIGDLLPVLIVASAVGMVDLWRRLSTLRPALRRWMVAITALGLFGIAANVGVAVSYQTVWSSQQVRTSPNSRAPLAGSPATRCARR